MKRFVHPFFGKGAVISNEAWCTVRFKITITLTRRLKYVHPETEYKKWNDYRYEYNTKRFPRLKGKKNIKL